MRLSTNRSILDTCVSAILKNTPCFLTRDSILISTLFSSLALTTFRFRVRPKPATENERNRRPLNRHVLTPGILTQSGFIEAWNSLVCNVNVSNPNLTGLIGPFGVDTKGVGSFKIALDKFCFVEFWLFILGLKKECNLLYMYLCNILFIKYWLEVPKYGREGKNRLYAPNYSAHAGRSCV